jgi:tetratricopeptide (TPR) repeat protein
LLGLALAASACAMTPALAQSISAQTTKIIELERAGKFSEALAIREKVLGQDHPDVARSLNNMADLYERQNRYAALIGEGVGR